MKISYTQVKRINKTMQTLSVELNKPHTSLNADLKKSLEEMHEMVSMYLRKSNDEDKLYSPQYNPNIFYDQLQVELKLITKTGLININESLYPLHDPSILQSVNGAWGWSEDITKENAWDYHQLLRHYKALGQVLDFTPMLGYFGKLVSLLPDIQFEGVNLDTLPNIGMLITGINFYVQNRLKYSNLDPENHQLNRLNEMLSNALKFMQQLIKQQRIIYRHTLEHYEKACLALPPITNETEFKAAGNQVFSMMLFLMILKRTEVSIHFDTPLIFNGLWYGTKLHDLPKNHLEISEKISKVKRAIDSLVDSPETNVIYKNLECCSKLLNDVISHENMLSITPPEKSNIAVDNSPKVSETHMKITYAQLNQINIQMNDLSSKLRMPLKPSQKYNISASGYALQGLVDVYLSDDKDDFKLKDTWHLIHHCTKWGDPEYSKSMNGFSKIPDSLTTENVWSLEQLEFHIQTLGKVSDNIPPLAYLGKLATLIPGVKIERIDISKLPDMGILIKSLEAYTYTRIQLGPDSMDKIDADRKLHHSLREVVTQTKDFMEQLLHQRKEIFGELIKQYEETCHLIRQKVLIPMPKMLAQLNMNKVMLVYYAKLLQPSLQINIKSLWHGRDFESEMLQKSKSFKIHIDKVKKDIDELASNSLSNKTIYDTLLTCQKLLDAVIYYEDLQSLLSLDDDEDIPSLDEEDLLPVQITITPDLEPQAQEIIMPVIDKTLIDDPQPIIPEETVVFDYANIDEDLLVNLGLGNTGEVFLSNDLKNRQPIAVKYFHRELALTDNVNHDLREISLLQLKEHPCDFLVRLFGVFHFDKNNGLVTEFVPGGTLSHALHESDEPLDWYERNRVSQEVIAGLFYLHAHNIIHGNFKTPNILITGDKHAKISDYGLSRLSSIPIALPYQAPEHFLDKMDDPTKESDVYSLGVILWEILTCKIPFNNMDDFEIRRYWETIFEEHEEDTVFEISKPSSKLPDIVGQTYTLLAPIVRACRQVDPEVRPRMEQIYQKCKL